MKPFSFHCCSPFFLGVIVYYSLHLCYLDFFIVRLGISMHSALILIVSQASLSSGHFDFRIGINLFAVSNQPIDSCRIDTELFVWVVFFRSTKLPQVMNMSMSIWFVFIQWIDNDMSCLRYWCGSMVRRVETTIYVSRTIKYIASVGWKGNTSYCSVERKTIPMWHIFVINLRFYGNWSMWKRSQRTSALNWLLFSMHRHTIQPHAFYSLNRRTKSPSAYKRCPHTRPE